MGILGWLGVVAAALLVARIAIPRALRLASRGGAARAHDDREAALARTAERYARAADSRGAYYYVLGKLRGDPSTAALLACAPLGDVVDLGCGRGQLDVLLLESGAARTLRGCDADAPKIAFARRASAGLPADVVAGDVRLVDFDHADTVLLVDVLHYFDRATQDALLLRAANMVRPGGRLFVRDATTGLGWRSTMTLLAERIATATRLNRGERLVFRDVERELVPLLEARGFACTVEPCFRGTPFGNVLLTARRAV